MTIEEQRKLRRDLILTRRVMERIEDCDISTTREDNAIRRVIAAAAALLTKKETK